MIVIPFIPVVTYFINRIFTLRGGRYRVYQQRTVLRHIVWNVWYHVTDFKSRQQAVQFVNFANSL
jgi:cbb3-type cytochrome oxidase subunit 1